MDDQPHPHPRQIAPGTRLVPTAPLAEALLATGFVCLTDPPDRADPLLPAGALFASADLRALLSLEAAPDGQPALHLRTILENGTLVETSERLPASFTPHSLLEAAMPSTPACRSVPGARYTLRLAPGDPAALWALHRARVARAEQRFGSAVRPHDSALIDRCIAARLRQIRDSQERRVGAFGQSVGVAAVVAAVLVLILGLALTMRWSDPAGDAPGAVRGLLLLLTGLSTPVLLGLPLLAAFNTLVAPRLPGPRPQPLAELLEQERFGAGVMG